MSRALHLNLAIAAIMAAGIGDVVLTSDTVNYRQRRDRAPELPKAEPRPFMPTNHNPHQGKKEIARRRKYWLKHRLLTENAWLLREDWEAKYGDDPCHCHMLHEPCESCLHPGNPQAQDEDDSCWKLP